MTAAAFTDPAWLRGVEDNTWVSILTATGELGRLQGGEFEPLSFSQSLGSNVPRGVFAEAIEVIHELGTDDGRALIAQAAADQNSTLDLSDDVPAMELAARMWLQSQTDPAVAKILVVARIGILDSSQDRGYHEYIGDRSLKTLLDKNALKEVVQEWCRQKKKYDTVEVISYERDGSYFFEVLRGDSIKRVSEMRDHRPAILNYRPALADHIRYEPLSGRIGIATRSRQLLSIYRELLSSMLAGRSDFFSDENVCSLLPLQQKGKTLFEPFLGGEILRVDVVRLAWRRGDRDRLYVQGNDCFGLLADLGARLEVEGALTEAKLSVAIAGRGRRAAVLLKVPTQIEISGAGMQDDTIRSLLSVVGIRGAAKGDGYPSTTWSRFPHRFTEQEWRKTIGPSFDTLLRLGVLRTTQLESVTHPDFRYPRNALTVVSQEGGKAVGISGDLAIPLRTLSPTDIQGYGVDWAKQGQLIGQALQLLGEVTEVESGLWRLGARELIAARSICVFMATRMPSAHWPTLTQQHAGGASPVLLVPADCSTDIGCVTAGVLLPSYAADSLLERIVRGLGWQDFVPPHLWLATDLVICSRTKKAWYRGTELTVLAADSHPFKFAEKVARANGVVVTLRELDVALSANRDDSDAAKLAKRDFINAAKSSFEAAGLPFPSDIKDLFLAKRGVGYVLGGSARVL